uniref:Uncharacterized protein n=1 Tax=uncultured marine bacterium MedDCM-OCT-S08-C1463 TaxID=743071 RepID=D6PDU1_9BACT|nr:hypothetical protein [uncultured marine bacterium MedDCM-OCT-S08-C1463]
MGLSNLVSEISYNAKYKIDNSISPILEVGIFENLPMISMKFCSRPFISFTISLTLSVFKLFVFVLVLLELSCWNLQKWFFDKEPE